MYLEHPPQYPLHRLESKNQHLKSLQGERDGKCYKFKDELRKKKASHVKELLFALAAGRLGDVTDIIYLPRIHRDLFGAIVDEVEFSAFVQGTSKLSFPFCGIGFINPLLELPSLHSPRLEEHRDRMEVSVSDCYFIIFLFLCRIHSFSP